MQAHLWEVPSNHGRRSKTQTKNILVVSGEGKHLWYVRIWKDDDGAFNGYGGYRGDKVASATLLQLKIGCTKVACLGSSRAPPPGRSHPACLEEVFRSSAFWFDCPTRSARMSTSENHISPTTRLTHSVSPESLNLQN